MSSCCPSNPVHALVCKVGVSGVGVSVGASDKVFHILKQVSLKSSAVFHQAFMGHYCLRQKSWVCSQELRNLHRFCNMICVI